MTYDAREIVEGIGTLADDDIDLGLAAIALAALDQSGISVERYVHHVQALADEVEARYCSLLKDTGSENAEMQLKALVDIVADEHAYQGDRDTYDDLQNVSLIRVIERMKGMPITLCILYISVGRRQGWSVDGLNVPGHFLCRLEHGGQRIVFDPFSQGKVLEASDIRLLVKKAMGERAELKADYFEPASNRDILIRLQNNIKHRLIADEEYAQALEVVQRMRLIDPNEYRLLLDAGVLYAKVEQNGAAIEALEDYLAVVPKAQIYKGETREAELLLAELRGKLN